MGVRLVRYNRPNSETGGSTSFNDHDELINRDMMNQHPVYAIIGLQEVLNILEDAVQETNQLLITKETEIYTEINTHVTDILADIVVIDQQIDDLINAINNSNTINSVIDTKSVDLTYDTTAKSLKADVKLYSGTKKNLIQSYDAGLYVPQLNPVNTTTVNWDMSSGETMQEFFANCIRFSHTPGSQLNDYSPATSNNWTYNDTSKYFVTPPYVDVFSGIVSLGYYDYYTHYATMKSGESSRGLNGLVIAHVFDDAGNPHTLTLVVDRSWYFNYALIYDLWLPGQQIIKQGNTIDGTMPGGYGSARWYSYPNGITARVTKADNLITAAVSNWNSTTINEATKFSIDLNDYTWGHLFKGPVHYGYCNRVQSGYFSNIVFDCDKALTSTLIAKVTLSKDIMNGLIAKSDGLFAETLKISAQAKNGLIKNADGFYIEKTEISTQTDNSLKKLADGLYVRDESNTKIVTKTAHDFVEGDFIFYHPTYGYSKALAVDDYSSNIVGMVCKVIDIDTFEYKWGGFHKTDVFNSSNGSAQGMPLYISDTVPGKTVQNQPDISKTVGYPIEDMGIIISIERGIQYNQEAAIGDFKQSPNTYNVRSDGFIRVIEGVLYKQTLIDRLLQTLDIVFKDKYIIFNDSDQTIEFKNTEELYVANNVLGGLNLFIKAF